MALLAYRLFGACGIVLLGAALALAPIFAFQDRMTVVSGLGIAGIACLLVAWAVRRLIPVAPDPRVGEDASSPRSPSNGDWP